MFYHKKTANWFAWQNKLAGFYMIRTFVSNELIVWPIWQIEPTSSLYYLHCWYTLNSHLWTARTIYLGDVFQHHFLVLEHYKYMRRSIQEWTKYNLWKTTFKKFEGIWSALGRPYLLKFIEGCLPQIFLEPSWILGLIFSI